MFAKNSWNKFICLLNCCNCFGNLVVGWMKQQLQQRKNACMVKGEHDVISFFSVNVIIAKKTKE